MKTRSDLLVATFVMFFTVNAQEVFQFAGYTFDQRNTPDLGKLIGDGMLLGGAQFASGLPTTTTGIIPGFPEGSRSGFNVALGLGQITGLGTNLRAVNLPNGNNGVATRQGIEVWWSGNRGLPNLPGDDLVIFEAASSIASVEGVMLRAHAVGNPTSPEQWTDWYYFPPAAFHNTMGIEGAFADVFDFSNMGLGPDAIVDRIQMANLTESDRVAGPGQLVRPGVVVATGRVVFDGSAEALPDAGSFDPNRTFDSTTYDPDPLYAAALHGVVKLQPQFVSISRSGSHAVLGVEAGSGQWNLESSDSLSPVVWQLVEHFTNTTSRVVSIMDEGQNSRPLPDQVKHRFYRVRME